MIFRSFNSVEDKQFFQKVEGMNVPVSQQFPTSTFQPSDGTEEVTRKINEIDRVIFAFLVSHHRPDGLNHIHQVSGRKATIIMVEDGFQILVIPHANSRLDVQAFQDIPCSCRLENCTEDAGLARGRDAPEIDLCRFAVHIFSYIGMYVGHINEAIFLRPFCQHIEESLVDANFCQLGISEQPLIKVLFHYPNIQQVVIVANHPQQVLC